jgi:hypothetical protein
MSISKIEGHPHFIRDNDNNAIINTDNENYLNYLKSSKLKKQEINRIETIEQDLSNIKEEMNQIKDLLIKLLEK